MFIGGVVGCVFSFFQPPITRIFKGNFMDGYNFKWSDLGDIKLGRPNLGETAPVAVYRLMQYTMKAVLDKEYGKEQADKLFVDAGRVAGVEFCKNMLDCSLPLNEFFASLQKILVDFSIGILKIEGD